MFGPLPIERAVIVRAKLRAVGILAGGFALAISSLSSLFHPALMVAKLPIGLIPALALIVIHLAVTLAAGLFAFASVVMVREVLRALLGVRFSRVSAGLQAVFIMALVTSFLLLPAILNRAGHGPSGGRRGCCRRSGSSACTRRSPAIWSPELPPGDAAPSASPARRIAPLARYREIATAIRPLAWRAVSGADGVAG